MLPVIQRFFPPSAMRPALHLAGTYGSGKSELAALMSSLYGRFDRDSPPAQWGDTINTVEALGHPLTDALYWVDDYKHIYADERTYTWSTPLILKFNYYQSRGGAADGE